MHDPGSSELLTQHQAKLMDRLHEMEELERKLVVMAEPKAVSEMEVTINGRRIPLEMKALLKIQRELSTQVPSLDADEAAADRAQLALVTALITVVDKRERDEQLTDASGVDRGHEDLTMNRHQRRAAEARRRKAKPKR